MSDAPEFALDRQSNVRLFERLANPHMLDDRRLEELKHLSEMRLRMPRGLTVEDDDVRSRGSSRAPTETDDDYGKDDDRKDDRNSSPRGSGRSDNSRGSRDSRNSDHRRGSPRGSNSSRGTPPRSSPQVDDEFDFRVEDVRGEERGRPEPRLSARSTGSTSSNRIDRKHHRFQPTNDDFLLPPTRTQPPALPSHVDATEEDEFARLKARVNGRGPTLLTRDYHSRRPNQAEQRFSNERSLTPIQDYNAPSSYNDMFRKVCQMRKRGGVAPESGGEYRPLTDPDYAEKRELLIKLDELRTLGFNVPKMDPAMPLEDLQTEITRRTISMGTVETVDTVVGWICSAATVLETLNNMAGPFLPMENYAQSVREGTQTPRFKYALYQLVLRHQGRHAGSPWRVVLMVLISPLIQGALIKLVQWLVKGRLNVSSSMIGTGLKTLLSMGKKKDPNKGVPSGIPGISPDLPKNVPENKAPAAPTSSNPFASFFKAATKMATPAPKLPPTSTVPPADGPVVRPPAPTPSTPAPNNNSTTPGRRVRLQRPNEINNNMDSASEVGVVTAEQIEAKLH